MMADITPKDVIKIIEATINFLDLQLKEENLPPGIEMDREETVDRLNTLVESLNTVESFTMKKEKKKKSKDSDELPSVNANNKQSTIPVYKTNTATVDSLVSKIKVLTKFPMAELKEQAEHSGYLRKYKKQLLSKWNRRFCVLRDGILLYFQSETDAKGKGFLILGGYKLVVPPNSNGFTFNLESYDKNTIYTFQSDKKDDNAVWQEYLSKVCDQGVTTADINAVHAALKEAGEELYIDSTDLPPNPVGNVSSPGVGNASCVPVDEEIYDDVAEMSEQIEYYGDVAEPGTAPIMEEEYDEFAPVQIPVPTTPPDNEYGDVAEPGTQPCEDVYEDIPANTNAAVHPDVSSGMSVAVPPRAPVALPGIDDFSTDNIYISTQDCTSEDRQDLSFNCGDVLYILEKIDMNWWMAFLDGQVGLVPCNFLRPGFAI